MTLEEIKRIFDMCEEITPEMGMMVKDGILNGYFGADYRKHFGLPCGTIVLPPTVKSIGSLFLNSPGTEYDEIVITSNVEKINSSGFCIPCVKRFAVVDVNAEKVLFEKGFFDYDRLLSCSSEFNDFCDSLPIADSIEESRSITDECDEDSQAWSFEELTEYIADNFGEHLLVEEDAFICPECNETIYKDNWDGTDEVNGWRRCPICRCEWE